MLAADSPKLQALLNRRKAANPVHLIGKDLHKGSEKIQPTFSVSDELVLRNFRSVLQNGLDDDALVNAIMFTFAFAVTEDGIDRECLGYQSEALSSIRHSMGTDRAPSESTLGAILLLAGIEVSIYLHPKSRRKTKRPSLQAQLGMPLQVQLHMGAILQLLEVCKQKGAYLSDSIKRAIFW